MSRYRCFITVMPGTVTWSCVGGTRRTTPTAKWRRARTNATDRIHRVVLTSAGRAVVNERDKNLPYWTNLSLCDRIIARMKV